MKSVWLLVIFSVFMSACGRDKAPLPPGVLTTETNTPRLTKTDAPINPTPISSLTSTVALPPPTETASPSPAASRTPSVKKLRDITYIPDGSHRRNLDIYLPTGVDGPHPTILTIHGGGGDKSDFGSLATRFVKQGFAVISINHREMPEDKYPAAVQDAFCALAWMQINAGEYNLDPEQFFALGHSSGGTLVASLGTVDNPDIFLGDCPYQLVENLMVRGVVTFTGIFDYPSAAASSSALESYINSYLGVEYSVSPEIWAEASPLNWVDGNEPPFLVIHGAADRNIDPRQSIDFAEAFDAFGVGKQLLIIPDSDHTGIIWSETAMEAVEKFFTALISP